VPVLLLRQIADGRHPGANVLAVGVVSMAWVNLHAAALLGVIITAACAALTAMRRDHRGAALWLLGAAVTGLAGMLINPYGFGVIGQTAQVQTASAGIMVEWQHVNPASPVQDLTLTLGALALVLAARRRDPVLAAALATTIAGSIFAIRLLPFVVLIGLPVVAAWASAPSQLVLRYARSRRVMFYRCGAIGALALIAVAVPSLTHIGRPNPATYPVRIVRAIPPGCRVFTTDLIGGFVILERPDVPVSLDTRNTLYGRQLLLAEERVLHGAGNLTSGLAGAGCVLVPPASGLARRLDNDQAWQIKATEPPGAVLFVRRPRLPLRTRSNGTRRARGLRYVCTMRNRSCSARASRAHSGYSQLRTVTESLRWSFAGKAGIRPAVTMSHCRSWHCGQSARGWAGHHRIRAAGTT